MFINIEQTFILLNSLQHFIFRMIMTGRYYPNIHNQINSFNYISHKKNCSEMST